MTHVVGTSQTNAMRALPDSEGLAADDSKSQQHAELGSIGSIDATATGTLPEFWPMRAFPERPALSPGDDLAIHGALFRALDEAAHQFEIGHWQDGMQLQHHAVREAHRALSARSWAAFAKIDCLSHPVRQFIHQDPFTRRSFQKPRGYAGDAVLIDYIYGIAHPDHDLNEATPLGRWLYNYASNTMAPRAVRHRMHLIAELIDRICCYRPRARILSIASGHMRELQLSHAVQAGVFEEIVAFDQDAASLAEVERTAASKAIRTVQGSISRLIAGRHDFADFDLVYAAGLFDYLEKRAARRLTETMFDMLKPGGSMLIANFLPDIYDIGYMESWMGWDLIYRDRAQIVALADGISSSIGRAHYFEESERNIGFLLVEKAQDPVHRACDPKGFETSDER